jgi:hypothetical protein
MLEVKRSFKKSKSKQAIEYIVYANAIVAFAASETNTKPDEKSTNFPNPTNVYVKYSQFLVLHSLYVNAHSEPHFL